MHGLPAAYRHRPKPSASPNWPSAASCSKSRPIRSRETVSHVDTGSHTDMDAATFARSAAVLRPYFAELADAGACDADMAVLRKIGLRAEHAMLAATGGVNASRRDLRNSAAVCGCRSARDAGDDAGRNDARCVRLHRWGAEILGGPRCRQPRRTREPPLQRRRRTSRGGRRFHDRLCGRRSRCVARSVTCRAIRKPRASMHASR